MKIITCDECHDIVHNSRDKKRFKPYEEIDNNIWCYDCLEEGNAPLKKEVKDDWLHTKSVCAYKFNVDDDIHNYKFNLEEKVVE